MKYVKYFLFLFLFVGLFFSGRVVFADITVPVSPSSGTLGIFTYTADGNGGYLTKNPLTGLGNRIDDVACTYIVFDATCDVSSYGAGVYDLWNYPSHTFSSSYTLTGGGGGGGSSTPATTTVGTTTSQNAQVILEASFFSMVLFFISFILTIWLWGFLIK